MSTFNRFKPLLFVCVFCLLQCTVDAPTIEMPVAKFTYTLEADGKVVFKNASTNAKEYLWTFGNGTTSTLMSPEVVFEENKDYSVELLVKNDAGQNSDKQIISVKTATTLIAKFSHKNLGNGKVQFINESIKAVSFLWKFDDGSTSVEKEPVHEFKKNGNFSVSLEASNLTSKATSKEIIEIKDIPVAIDISSLTLHPSGKYVEYLTTTTELNDWNLEKEESYVVPLCQKLYAKFQDSFDYIFVTLNNNSIPSTIGYYGKYRPVKNTVKGIGQSTFDNSKNYGSSGNLKGFVQIAYRSAIQNGPTLHELAHSAANYAVPTFSISNGTQIDFSGHWGFSDAGGQLGGFKAEFVTENLDGVAGKIRAGFKSSTSSFSPFANGGNSVPYSDLELYLMGLAPKEEVPDLKVYSGLSLAPNDTRSGVFMAKEIKTYTINDIIGKNGVRDPSFANGQKQFRILNVLLTAKTVSEVESSELINQIDWLAFPNNDNSLYYNFYEATKGRGTLKSNELEKVLR